MSNYIDNIVKNAVTYDLVSKPLADDMANEFSIKSTYAVGDYVMHDYKLYKCISAVTTAGNWDSAKWQECKIGDEINGGVKFTAQTLTSEQKAQARNNIGSASQADLEALNAVRYDQAQTLTTAQKTQARANIGAVSQEEATPDAIRYSAQSLTEAQKNQARVNTGTVASTSIAEEFSTSKAYAVGDLVMYDSKLYKFKTAHSVGAWNNAQVDAVSVKEEISSLSNDLSDLNKVEIGGFVYGYYISIRDPQVIDIDNPTEDYRYKYAIVDCKPGDVFFISGYGGDSPRVYCFVSSNNTKLSYSNSNENLSNRKVVAPTNAAKVIIQDRATDSSQDGKGLPSYKVMDMSGAVRFDIAQDKTEEEKARGRANLGVNLGDVVMTTPQTLSDAQKAQVRTNIGINETSGLSNEAKNALLALLRKVAYVVENGEEYYRALREALNFWLFNLTNDFASTGTNNVDTEIVLEEGKEYTVLLCIIPSNDTVSSPTSYTMLYSNRRNEDVSAYVGMHVSHTGNSIGVNGAGIDSAIALTKSKIAYIATTLTSDRMMTSLVEVEKSGEMYSGTKQYEASKIYNGFSLLLGYQGTPNNQGFHGVFKDFKVVDYLLTDREIKSYVATGKADYKILIMEIGNIDTSGVDDDTIDVRIRTKNYISVNDTLTLYGCPFASTWEAYSGRGGGDGYIIGGWYVRCYDLNKQFIGSTYPTVPDVRTYDNESLPTGTKYIRIMLQRGTAEISSNHYTKGFSSYAIYPLVIDGNAYFIEEGD